MLTWHSENGNANKGGMARAGAMRRLSAGPEWLHTASLFQRKAMNKSRQRKGICPQMTQMDADEELLFFISALICVICGQFRIRFRLAALGFLRLFAAKSLVFYPTAQTGCVPLCLMPHCQKQGCGFRRWDIMAHLNPKISPFTMLNSPLAAPQLSLIHGPKLRLIKVN
jgi:hypothetical protein